MQPLSTALLPCCAEFVQCKCGITSVMFSIIMLLNHSYIVFVEFEQTIAFSQQPTSIVSYNHLGNNDGKNLSAPKQFRSKEISKSNVVDDMVESNDVLYSPGEHPDHCVSEGQKQKNKYCYLLYNVHVITVLVIS